MRFWMMAGDDYPPTNVPVGETIVRSVKWTYNEKQKVFAKPCDLEVVTEANIAKRTPQVAANADRTFACISNIPTGHDQGAAQKVGAFGDPTMEALSQGFGVESDLLGLTLTEAPLVRLRVLSYAMTKLRRHERRVSIDLVEFDDPDAIPGEVVPVLLYCEPVEIISLAWPEERLDEWPD